MRSDALARDATLTVYLAFFIATVLIGLTFYVLPSMLPSLPPGERFDLTQSKAIIWQDVVRKWNAKHSVMAMLKRAAEKRVADNCCR